MFHCCWFQQMCWGTHCVLLSRWRWINFGPLYGHLALIPCSANLLQTVCALILLLFHLCVAAAVVVAVRNWLRKCDILMWRSWAHVITWGLPERGRSAIDPDVMEHSARRVTVTCNTPNWAVTSAWRLPDSSIPMTCNLDLAVAFRFKFNFQLYASFLHLGTSPA